MKPTIFIAEDDPDILELLQFNLDKNGFRVKSETNGEKAFETIVAHPPDLLILDLNLPALSGIEICKYLRENPRTKELPVIMLTARSQEIDKIIGFEIGADDYVTKPFSMREFLARINALLRRSRPGLSNVAKVGELSIFLHTHQITCKDKEVTLTPTEYKLLEAMVNVKGRVLSRQDLIEMVWGMDYYGEIRTVDVHVKRLRDKLGDCSDVIETVKGTGYRIKMKL